MSGSPPVSIVILTLNEEINIRACIESCAWCEDVHVLDSGSTDRTREIAQEMGAGVHVNPFESFGKQRNWAIDNIPVKNDWIFHLDADERFTPELIEALATLMTTDPAQAGFLVPNKLMFMDTWLKKSGGYPAYQVRLFHRKRMRFTDYGHGQREETEGDIGKLDIPYLHYAFSKGLYEWFDKHNRYSSLEAIEFLRREHEKPSLRGVFSGNSTSRRRALKRILYGVPGWPFIHMFAKLFVLGGIFEGKAGVTYATMLAIYEQMIRLKVRLLRHARTQGSTRSAKNEADVTPRAPSTTAATPFAEGSSRPTPHAPIDDADIIPDPSPWTTREKMFRTFWMMLGRFVFRATPQKWHNLRCAILRLFGAKVGRHVRIDPTAYIEITWNIELGDACVIHERAILYALGRITIGRRATISRYAHLCAGTHDHTDRALPLIRDPITIGEDAWIGPDAFIGPNVRVGDRAALVARASAYKDLDPDTIYSGNPAKPITKREFKAS